ncbi:flagellin lysine-N-methylase [Leptothrix discophora]|uniref:Flagellin lysine-N-methylase n=1 Tax=Leptothrix discophora TaxID=89 RepID=A0ABT9G6C6_LEPDI|nr:flagellin lysine-N-methylase [Leptothrix discophora]MDP4302039.1 flagellin lysine-N-methylase [Leptothrix discophora]
MPEDPMAKFSPTAQMPRYLQAFQCVGPACPETCCSGWRVTIDKATFKKMKAIGDEPLRRRIAIHLVKDDDSNPAAWGHLQMEDNGDCGFLDADRLCSIQKQLGANALSDTCNHYPRQFQQVDGEHRVQATLSCPEAARLALTDAEAMAPVAVTLEQFANASELPPGMRWNDGAGTPKVSHLGGRVLHDLLVSLFDAPGLGAFDALALGLMLVRRVNGYVQELAARPEGSTPREQRLQDLSELFSRFMDAAHNTQLLEVVRGLEAGTRFAPDMLRTVTRMIWQRRLTASARTMLGDVVAGLRLDEADEQVARERWAEARRLHWDDWARGHGHMLRNYLVNSLQSSLIGRHFGTPQALEDAYLDLVIRAALVRYWLIGQMALHGDAFTPEMAVRTVYALSRSIEHDRRFMAGVLQTMDEQGIRSLATGVVLIQ